MRQTIIDTHGNLILRNSPRYIRAKVRPLGDRAGKVLRFRKSQPCPRNGEGVRRDASYLDHAHPA